MRRRRRIRRRGDDLVAPEIPWDLMIEILTRLPGKSLMRFKCVSKLWFYLIRSRSFSSRYLTVPRPPRLYVSWVEHGKTVLLSISSTSATSFDQDLTTMPGMGGHNMVVLRGLILYTVCRKACVYNPSTRQSVTLPAVKSGIFARQGLEKNVFYFLGHDPVLDQYKVVCNVVICSQDLETLISEHWVFVLEAGGSWKRIEFDLPHVVPTRLGICINGVIYYLARPYVSCDILVCFDVRSEELSMIQAPSSDFEGLLGFIEYGGKPTLFDYTHHAPQGLVDLWVLEDGGKWWKKSLALQACQLHLVNNDTHGFVVQCTTQNGEVIFAPRPMASPSYFLFYNLEKNDLRKVDIRGIWDHWLCVASYLYSTLMDKSESILHLET